MQCEMMQAKLLMQINIQADLYFPNLNTSCQTQSKLEKRFQK